MGWRPQGSYRSLGGSPDPEGASLIMGRQEEGIEIWDSVLPMQRHARPPVFDSRVSKRRKRAPGPLPTRHCPNPRKTVLKKEWETDTTADAHDGAQGARQHGCLTPAEEAMLGGIRTEDTAADSTNVLGCMRDPIPNLSRRALHSALQRHDLPECRSRRAKEQRKREAV